MDGGKRERAKVSFRVVFKMSICHLITVLMTLRVVSGVPAEEFVTARDLLAPEMFPDTSFGMAIERVGRRRRGAGYHDRRRFSHPQGTRHD